jgi:hypothetical protein
MFLTGVDPDPLAAQAALKRADRISPVSEEHLVVLIAALALEFFRPGDQGLFNLHLNSRL